MIYRLAIGVLAALAVAIIVPAQGHADPPTKCLTNTPKGKQVYVPCDLLNAGANFPPGHALSSTARAVPERCGGLVWRRPRPCESHARESYEPDKSREPDDSCEPDDSYGPDES